MSEGKEAQEVTSEKSEESLSQFNYTLYYLGCLQFPALWWIVITCLVGEVFLMYTLF